MAGPMITRDFFTVVVTESRVTAKVHRRPDLDANAGAKAGVELRDDCVGLARKGFKEIVLDLRDAPPVAGPRTSEALGQLLASCASLGARVAMVVSSDAVQLLQAKRLIAENARNHARVTTDMASAEAWLNQSRKG